jgi:hypothetical protein
MSSRLRSAAQLAVATYPPSFRARYGEELRALVDEQPPTVRGVADLVLGSARAWMTPSFVGDDATRRRQRLQASIATVWVAGCLGSLTVPGVTRALTDPRPAGSSPAVDPLLSAAQYALAICGGLLVTAGVMAGLRVGRDAFARRRWRVLRPLVPGVILAGVEAVGIAVVAVLRRGHPSQWPHPSVAFMIAGSLWVLGFGVLVAAVAVGPAVALHRAAPPARHLAPAAALAMAASVALAISVLLCAAAAVVAASAVAIVGTVYGLVTATIALTSAARSARSLVSPSPEG